MDIVIEIGNSHEGSLGIATSFVDIAREVGANCVKFQLHLAEYEGMPNEPFRKQFSIQDSTRQNYWKRVNFSENNWKALANYVNSLDIEFMCTPFSVEAAEFLFVNKLVKRWKVGSGDAVNFPLIDYLAKTRLPLIISTGLISWEEIIKLKKRLVNLNVWENTTLMHCISMYPTPLEKSSLNLISDLKELGCKVGLSDHSGNWKVAVKAISMGIDTLEVHMTPHKLFFGPDTVASLEPEEIRIIRQVWDDWLVLDQNPGQKDVIFSESRMMGRLFRKGIYWSKSCNRGDVIDISKIKFRKPVETIDSKDFERVLGRKLLRSVNENEPVKYEDLE